MKKFLRKYVLVPILIIYGATPAILGFLLAGLVYPFQMGWRAVYDNGDKKRS